MAFQWASGELELVCALVQWKERETVGGSEVIRACIFLTRVLFRFALVFFWMTFRA